MTKKTILFMTLITLGTITVQASESLLKREFTVTTIALDAQEIQEIQEELYDINETNEEGGKTKDK